MQLSAKDQIIHHLFKDIPYGSPLEQAYCDSILNKSRNTNVDLVFWGTIGISILSMALSWFAISANTHLSLIFEFHAVILGVMLLWPVARRFGANKKYFVVPMNILCWAGWALSIHLSDLDPTTSTYASQVFTLLLLTYFLSTPFYHWQLDALATAACLFAVAAYWQHPDARIFVSINILTIVGASSLNRIIYRRNRIHTIARFREQSRYLPKQVVLRSVIENKSLAEVFIPANRTCVCISSDWRNYQKLTGTFAPKELAELLRGYYEMTTDLLEEFVPRGNYFCDWIADELFVVLYSDLPLSEAHLWNQAIDFSTRLVLKKSEFLQKYGAPEAIDIGIAGGQAFVGLMGPTGQAKTTALGEIPGQARRVQGLGKILRAEFGESDRIIFSTALVGEIDCPLPIESYELKQYQQVRDLGEKRFFYLEPSRLDAAPRLSAPAS